MNTHKNKKIKTNLGSAGRTAFCELYRGICLTPLEKVGKTSGSKVC
jgi:hypothetical protein